MIIDNRQKAFLSVMIQRYNAVAILSTPSRTYFSCSSLSIFNCCFINTRDLYCRR